MKVVIGERYRHYKNNNEYVVLHIGFYTGLEPLQECVVYQAQYATDDLGKKPIFIRPREMFEESVDVGTKMMDRFQLIG